MIDGGFDSKNLRRSEWKNFYGWVTMREAAFSVNPFDWRTMCMLNFESFEVIIYANLFGLYCIVKLIKP